MLPLDKGLAQYYCMMCGVLEQSPLFWTATISGLALLPAQIFILSPNLSLILLRALELSAPQVTHDLYLNVTYEILYVLQLPWTLQGYFNGDRPFSLFFFFFSEANRTPREKKTVM